MTHYSDKITQELKKLGWVKTQHGLEKTIVGAEEAGQLSNGDRTVAAGWCERDRYLTCIQGFETPFDMDMREYDRDAEAGAKEFDRRVLGLYKKVKA